MKLCETDGFEDEAGFQYVITLHGKIVCRGDVHRKWVKWNGMSSPFYPAGVEWNENPFHFAPEGQFSM